MFPDQDIMRPFTFRVQSSKNSPSYVRLLYADFQKDGIKIDVPEMKDPTIGRMKDYGKYLDLFKGQEISIASIFLWCPELSQHLDLFTLHIYELDPADPDNQEGPFTNLRIAAPRPDPLCHRHDMLWMDFPDSGFVLTENTRISFIVPAHVKMMLELIPEKLMDSGTGRVIGA